MSARALGSRLFFLRNNFVHMQTKLDISEARSLVFQKLFTGKLVKLNWLIFQLCCLHFNVGFLICTRGQILRCIILSFTRFLLTCERSFAESQIYLSSDPRNSDIFWLIIWNLDLAHLQYIFFHCVKFQSPSTRASYKNATDKVLYKYPKFI